MDSTVPLKPPSDPAGITIRLFAMLREATGESTIQVPIHEPETVGAVLDRLVAERPVVAPFRKAMRAAVNREYVGEGHVIQAGDELAIITPVSGG